MWDLTWALKKSFKVSVSTMYFSLDRRKTRLESVLHSVSVCVSHRSLLSIINPKSPAAERERERGGVRRMYL